jgi:DNA-binding CsgD family transcriptional regulator
MALHAEPDVRGYSPDGHGSHDDVEMLLKRLLARLGSAWDDDVGPTGRHLADSTDAVILEMTIDEVQYTLIRSQPEPRTRAGLSPRELTIARLVAKGLPNKSISDLLEISPWTVAAHLRRIFSKLGVNTRAAMIARLTEKQHLM